MTWFESLVGFVEQDGGQVRSQLVVEEEIMTSLANGRQMRFGSLEICSLAELRAQVRSLPKRTGKLRLSEVVADVQQLHLDAKNSGALFQVASQFNLLEMVSPEITPEDGVGRYEFDRTQGPACAIACGAATIYRNYLVPLAGDVGQTESNQIDCLSDLGQALGNADGRLWNMKNGYALATSDGLREISAQLSSLEDSDRDQLRELLKIGIQWNAEVTLADIPASHSVSQAFCSALPVAYCPHPGSLWTDFARLVLEASYEATMAAAVLNSFKTGNDSVYLTLLGGGAFGNEDDWIIAAIHRALRLYSDFALDVSIVSYEKSKPSVQQLLSDY